jgi:hypothetical protein
MKSVIDLMNKEVYVLRGNEKGIFKQKLKIIERFAELIAVNGGTTNVTQWGRETPTAEHAYYRLGLTQREALELINLTGMFTGYCECEENEITKATAMKMIQEEIDRVKKEGFDPLKNAEPIELPGESPRQLIQVYDEAEMKALVRVEKQVERVMKTGR